MTPFAVLLSGRGTNMEALARNSLSGNLDGRIVLVASDNLEAEGLAKAASLGFPTKCYPYGGIGRLSFEERVSKDIADLAARTRDNKLTPDELAGGTFTLTNTGPRGALFDTPLVFLPQVAILGTGAVVKRAVVTSGPDGDAIAVRSMVYLALSYDHHIVDGADAARFLTQVKSRLEAADFEGVLGI